MKPTKKKRGTPARKQPAPSRALVIRGASRLPVEVLPPQMPPVPQLAQEPTIGAAFVGTLKLNEQQIAALRRPVEDREIEFKPTYKDGPPDLPYLSHNGYRDRLDAAFGLGGWGMAPVGQARREGDVILVPYALVVDGLPRVYAWGEQALHKMTYGDALEGAKSNAIMRCGKELGIARELWNRKNLAELKGRLLVDRDREAGNSAGGSRAPSAGSDAWETKPITEKQYQRLRMIAKNAGRSAEEMSMWLKAKYGLDSGKQIIRRDYDAICSAVEKPGPLPVPEE